MKLKGINPIEQHIEKIVLGVFVLAALAMVALQFLTPSTVKVQQKELPLDVAYQQAIAEAARLQGRLRSTDLPQGIPTEIADVAASAGGRLTTPVAPDHSLTVPLGFVAPMREGGVVGPELPDAEYAAIVPPAPVAPVARSYAGAVDPVAVQATPGLAAFVPPQQPYDIRAVSVQATFPASELVRQLDSDPDGAGPQQAYPKFLWINRLAIFDIELERQRLLPDGQYSEPEMVPPVPGMQSVRASLDSEGLTRAVYQSIVAQAREQQRAAIVRPAFIPLIAGEGWQPPAATRVAVAAQPGADAGELPRLRNILQEKQRELDEVEKALQAPAAPAATQGSKMRGQGIGPGGGGGGSRDERGPSAEERRRENLTKRRDRLRTDIAGIQAQIDAIAGTGAGAESAVVADPVGQQQIPALDVGEDFTLWAHDLTAEPGATYRYRMRVITSNPLFGDRSRPDAEATLAGDFSEWSEPVAVAPETMVFFTSAQVGIEGQAMPQTVGASAEVYTFFYGYWRKADVRLAPGDAIAATVQTPAMPIYRLGEAGAVQDGQTPSQIQVAMDAFLVDIVQTAGEAGLGQRRSELQVVFRDSDGKLVSRSPERDRASEARLRAEAAARAGLSGEIRTPGAQTAAPGRGGAQPAPGGNAPAPAQRPPAPGSAPRPGGPGRIN